MKRFLRCAAVALRELTRPRPCTQAGVTVCWKGQRGGDKCPATPDAALFDTLTDIDLGAAVTPMPLGLVEPAAPASPRPG